MSREDTLTILFLFTLPLFSTSLEWSWINDDENIKFYRYQTNINEEWILVESDVTSITTEDDVNTLILEASYDGINWSEPTQKTYTKPQKDIGFVNISWTNDNNYKYFRYQRDSEDKNGWTITDGSTESAVLPYHKGENTYFLQASYDGVLWSESTSCTYIKRTCTCDTLLWSWDTTDPLIKYFRYQLDKKDESGWSVVDGRTKEIELPAREGENSLYVESSYDGVIWSEATVGTYNYEPEPYRTRKWEAQLSLIPYAYQNISYTIPNTVTKRGSVYGGGVGVEIRYNFNPVLSLGSALFSEHYKYESFHVYHDFKLTATLGVRIIGSDSSRNKLYLTAGGGVDFVLRDDGGTGCYPLLSYGVRDTFNITDRITLGVAAALNHTFQNGTSVFNIIPSISLTYTWGCKAGCIGCKGGCR